MTDNLLVIQAAKISAPGEKRELVLILEDPGLTHNLITRDLAIWLKLPSQTTSCWSKVLGHHCKEQRLRTYVLTVAEKHGAKHTVQAIGVDNITEVTNSP